MYFIENIVINIHRGWANKIADWIIIFVGKYTLSLEYYLYIKTVCSKSVSIGWQ